MTDVLLPDIGDFRDVEVIEILVQPGDSVVAEDPLITLESDKASIEIPAPQAGVVGELKVSIGDKINQGDLLLTLQAQAAAPVQEDDAVEPPPAESVDHAPPVVEAPAEAAPAVASSGDVEAQPITVPDIGDFKDVEVIEILVGVGDRLEIEQSLITLESDKASIEIPSPLAGVVTSLAIKIGDRVSKGDLVATVETAGAQSPAPTEPPSERPATQPEVERAPGEKEQQRRPVMARPDDAVRSTAHASPGVRRFARELGVDLGHVDGSGPKERITKEDVQAYVKRALGSNQGVGAAGGGALQLPTMSEVDFSQFGAVEERELGRIKKLSGAHLHRAWLNVPHVTQFDEADITELEAFRKAHKQDAAKDDIKLTFMPFLIKAVGRALIAFPQFNSSLSSDGDKLILKKYVHIGIAVDTPNGLIVPVVRDVDKKGVFELAADIGELSAKARAGKLAPGDLQGGCMSISSLGGIGGTQFTPIVNAPEVAILGVSRAQMKPVWDGSEFQPKLIMPFCLSYDHRVIDGAEGVRFSTYLAGLLSDIRRLLL